MNSQNLRGLKCLDCLGSWYPVFVAERTRLAQGLMKMLPSLRENVVPVTRGAYLSRLPSVLLSERVCIR